MVHEQEHAGDRVCGQNTAANFSNLAICIRSRTIAAVDEDDDGEEVEVGEDDDLENDGDDVSDDEEQEEEV